MKRNRVEDLERELIGYFPQSFVLMYYDLVERGHAQYTSPLGHPGEGGQQTGKRYVTHDGGIRDEEALAIKRKIDRTLRQIVRDVEKGNRSGRPKCVKCAKFMDHGWAHCAWCGADVRGAQQVPPRDDESFILNVKEDLKDPKLGPERPVQRPGPRLM
ncbi:hypothetical protein SEA_ORLA_70 [Gordonia phage Orla]|nr:hypothetical protein SEA_ORLA_70 [Gordonia phage Orla]